MKVTYDKKTIDFKVYEYNLMLEEYERRKKRTKHLLILNLITILITIFNPLYNFFTHNPFTLTSFILNIIAILGVLVSVYFNKKCVPSEPIPSPAVVYHVCDAANNTTIISTTIERTPEDYEKGTCLVFFKFKAENEKETQIPFGEFEYKESSDVTEKTIELDKRIVYAPIKNDLEAV